MLGYFKDAYNYVADKALDAKEAIEEIRLTRGEKIGVTAAAVSAWPLFSLVFGSAPLTLVTAIATPVATTALLGAGYLAAKSVKFFMDNNRWTSDYAPEFGPDHASEEGYGKFSRKQQRRFAADVAGLEDDFAMTQAGSYTHRTLLHRGNQPVNYTLAPINKAEVDAMPHKTTRSGKGFGF